MSEEELENFEADMEMHLFREYRDVLPMFTFVVETERRFYLANSVEVIPHEGASPWFEVVLGDAWVWDMYRPARFVSRVQVMTTRDVNIEELSHKDDALGAAPPS
jgi:hypothetical protein